MTTREQRIEIELAEDQYTGYIREVYGPLMTWDQNEEIDRRAAELRALYERYNVDEFDRIAL
jgi:hypothetical protein